MGGTEGPGEERCQLPRKSGQGLVSSQKTGRDFGGDVSNGASAFSGLCLPTGIGDAVQKANSLCNKERQEMGRQPYTQREKPYLKDMGERQPRGIAAILQRGRQLCPLVICMMFYSL